MTSDQTAQPLSPVAPLTYDVESGRYQTWYDPDEDVPSSQALVAAIAAIEACDPCDLSVALYDCIDPDALDALFRSRVDGTSWSDGRVEFTFGTYDVHVHAEGRITIRSRQS